MLMCFQRGLIFLYGLFVPVRQDWSLTFYDSLADVFTLPLWPIFDGCCACTFVCQVVFPFLGSVCFLTLCVANQMMWGCLLLALSHFSPSSRTRTGSWWDKNQLKRETSAIGNLASISQICVFRGGHLSAACWPSIPLLTCRRPAPAEY